MHILVFGPILLHDQHYSHGPKTTLKKLGGSLPLQPIFQNRIFQNYLNCIEKGQKEHTKCYMISNPTPKFTRQIRSIRSVFGRNRTGTGFEKIDRIDRNRNRNRISGRTLITLTGPAHDKNVVLANKDNKIQLIRILVESLKTLQLQGRESER